MKSFILINNFTFKEVRDCLIDVTGCGAVMVHPWPSVQQSLQNCIPQRVNFISEKYVDFPGAPVVKNPSCNAGGTGLVSGQATEIPRAN